MEFLTVLDESEPSFSVVAQDVGEQDITLCSNTPEPVLASTAHKAKVHKDLINKIPNFPIAAGSYIEGGSYDREDSNDEKNYEFLEFMKKEGLSQCSEAGKPFSPVPTSSKFTGISEDSSLSMLDFESMPDPFGSLVHVDSNVSLGSWLDDIMPDRCQDDKPLSCASPATLLGSVNTDASCHEKTSSAEQSRLASRYLMSESQLVGGDGYSDSLLGTPSRSYGNSAHELLSDKMIGCGTTDSKDKTRSLLHPTDEASVYYAQEEDAESKSNFEEFEFQNAINLQQQFFASEEFTGDVAEVLDKEEEIFEEEHKLMMNSREEIEEFTGSGFTTVAESQISEIHDPKVSIGEYMAARSGKMGNLGEAQISVERPSFGLKIRTPSPRKPYPLQRPDVGTETYIAEKFSGDSTESEEESSFKNSMHGSHDGTVTEEGQAEIMTYSEKILTPDENANDETQNTTLEPSMLSLSEAIMNMSTSVNNEELARAIIEISKKKKQEKFKEIEKKRQPCQEKKITDRPEEEKSSEFVSSNEVPKFTRRSSKLPIGTKKTSPPKPVKLEYHKKREFEKEIASKEQRKQHSMPGFNSSTLELSNRKGSSDVGPAMIKMLQKTSSGQKLTEEIQKQEQTPLRSVENISKNSEEKPNQLCMTKRSDVTSQENAPKSLMERAKVAFSEPLPSECEKPKNWNPILQESFMQDTPVHDEIVKNSALENNDEMPTFNNGRDSVCFPDEVSSKYLLSSTRTDLSLTRGSLSRESIEELHKKLRVCGPRTVATKAVLPDLISPPATQCVEKEIAFNKNNDVENVSKAKTSETKLDKNSLWKNDDMDSRESKPLSQSSPDWKTASCRYSGEFHQMLPSMSFAEMATIQEHQFDQDDLMIDEEEKGGNIHIPKLDIIKEVAETTQDTTLHSTASGDSQLASEIAQDAITHSTQHSIPPHVPMLHPSQHLYPPMQHVMYRPPSAMSSSSLPTPYPGDMHYRHMDTPYQLPPEYTGRGHPLMYQPHSYSNYPMSASFNPHHVLHATTTQMGYQLEQPSMASSAEIGLNHTTSTMYQQQGTYHHPGVILAPRSATIDGRFPSIPGHYYRQQQCRVSCGLDAAISVPSEFEFQGVRCVSLISHAKLPITNKSDRWIQVELSIVSPAIDCCFSLDSKPLVGPHDTKHVEISFSPKKQGRFEALLEVISYPVGSEGSMSQSNRSQPTMVGLKAVAEVATAEFQGPDEKHEINFKETLCDSAKYLPLRIINKGLAEIPVCVVLCTKSQDRKCFAISDSSHRDWSEQDEQSQAIFRTVIRSCDQITTLWIHCRIPPKHCDASEPPKNISAQVYMEIDNSQKQSLDTMVLDSISVEVTACVAKLHAPKNMQPLVFNCSRESSQTRKLPVKNCGNISSRVSFLMLNYSDLFSVSPSHALLAAGEHIQVSIKFKPISSTSDQFNATLLMKIEPNGTKYEVGVIASCVQNQTKRQSLPLSYPETHATVGGDMPSLLTNKSHICWGGVPVGHSSQQRVVLRTSSGARKSLSMRVMIKGEDASCFQILKEDDKDREELCSKQEMTMNAGKDKIIKILFGPTKCRRALAKLEIKAPVDQVPSTKFTIPLSGYGGRSEVKVTDLKSAPKDGDGSIEIFAANIKNLTDQNFKFTVQNTSSRDAFVKIVSYSDQLCQDICQTVSCSPSQFVLLKRTSRTISLSFQNLLSLQRSGYSGIGKGFVASVCMWHGDEIARHLLKSALSKLGRSAVNKCLSESNTLHGIVFDSIFEGDSATEEDLSQVNPQFGDVQVFYTGIRKTVIQVYGPPSDRPLLEKVEHSKNATVRSSTEPVRDMKHKAPLSNQHYKRPNQSEVVDESWQLSLDHVILSAPHPNRPAEPSKIKVINRSGSLLRFDVAWSGHYLTITPHSGQVDPESVLVMLLSANPSLSSRREHLPWLGTVQVSAQDGRGTKQLRVQIRDDIAPLDASVQPSTPVPRLPLKAHYSEIPSTDSFATPMTSGSSRINHSVKNTGSNKILLDSAIVDFGSAYVKSSAKSYLEFTNVCPGNIRWLLTSFAPAYVKDIEPTGDLYRSTYAAFVFSHTSGLLEPGAKVKIPVSFNPMSEGNYSQFWDLEHHEASDSAALSLNKIRIQVLGQGIKSTKTQSHTASVTKVKDGNGIYVSDDQVKFPDANVREFSIVKIPVKNRSKESHNVKFINVRPPFHITHQRHTIRPMSYACLPVTFKPTMKGEFEGTLVIQTEESYSISIKLLGKGL